MCTSISAKFSIFKPKNYVSTSRPLKLLHMDLFGPTRTLSLGGKWYGLVISDDYFWYSWLFFLAYESFHVFEIFYKIVYIEQGYSISIIKSTMKLSLKIENFKSSINQALNIDTISLYREHLNIMKLWKRRIKLSKRWLELCCVKTLYQSTSGKGYLTMLVMYKIEYW